MKLKIIFCSLCSLLILGISLSQGAATPKDFFQAAIGTECCGLIVFEEAALANSLLDKKLQEMKKPDAAVLGRRNPDMSKVRSLMEAIQEELEINGFDKNIRSQWSLKINIEDYYELELSELGSSEGFFKHFDFIGVNQSVKALAPTVVKQAIEKAARENQMPIKISQAKNAGYSVLEIYVNEKLPLFSIAFASDDQIQVFGQKNSVEQVLKRLSENKLNPMPAALDSVRKGLPADSQSFALFTFPENMQAYLKEMMATPEAQNHPMASQFANLSAMSLGLSSKKDTIDFSFALQTTTPEAATMLKTMLFDGFLLGMGKMYLLQSAGKPIPMLETMKSRQNGRNVSFNCILTEEDLQVIANLVDKTAKSWMQNAGQFGGAEENE